MFRWRWIGRGSPITGDMIEIEDHTAPHLWRAVILWLGGIGAVAATLLLCFLSFGATVALAVGLTVMAVGYMCCMGRWVSHRDDRRDW